MSEKDNDTFDESKRPHRKRQAGPKYDKKKSKDDAEKNVVKPKNPKAYSFHSLKKTERAVRRAADLGERKIHRPVVHRQSALPPPVLVAVVGPPKVGKTTLIRCLIKNFTGKNVLTVKGPVTIVSSKRLRITFIECNNDLNSMIDLAKTADLALLLSNAQRGFEMEVFEFINLVEAHGKMRMMGVLTHIDQVRNRKLIQKREQFWKKSVPKAKLFKLSKIIDIEYQKKEIENLGRFIEVMKYEPIEWRTTHPYVLVDRVEDMTDPEELKKNGKMDRTVCMFGYVRGTHFEKNSGVHVLGVGDFALDEMNFMPDPCPFPWELKKRSLNKQERLVYAPFSGVGGVLMDKDAVYIETATIQSLNTRRRMSEKDKLLQTFNNVESDDAETKDATVFEDEEMNEEDDDDDDMDEEGDDEDDESLSQLEDQEDMEVDNDDDDDDNDELEGDDFLDDDDGEENDGEEEDDDDSEDDNDNENEDKKAKLQLDSMRKGIHTFLERHKNDGNIQRLIYDCDPLAEEKEDDEGSSLVDGLFKVAKSTRKGKLANQIESSVLPLDVSDFNQEDIDKLLESVQDRIKQRGQGNEDDDNDDDDGGMSGDDSDKDFEYGNDEEDDSNNEEEEDEDDKAEEEKEDKSMTEDYEEPETAKERRARRRTEKMQERKRRQKELFDSMYDDENPGKKNHFETLKEEMAQQAQINMSEFGELNEEARTQFEGFRPGLYVRLQVKGFPGEFIDHFDPAYPLVVGGLLNQERNVGYITVALNKHRWYKGMLKTDDPLTVSLGWRRFQTIPIYSMRDDNGRNRRVKAIQGIGFQATFWGPLTPQASGMAAVGTHLPDKKEFRVCATGVVREVDQAPAIQKKLKLCGEPFLINTNTAFVEKMFNSDLELTKFLGAQIKTVSGIRGVIKKPVQNAWTLKKALGGDRQILPGSFRATFEDKIKMSDIVFLTAWVKTSVEQFYNLVSNLLLPLDQRGEWKGMRTAWEIRIDKGIKRNPDEKSLYKDIVRPIRKTTDLKIPRDLLKELPFEFRPKKDAKVVDSVKRVAVIRDPKERKVEQMMKQLKAIYDEKRKEKRAEMRGRAATHKKQMALREKKKGLKEKSKK